MDVTTAIILVVLSKENNFGKSDVTVVEASLCEDNFNNSIAYWYV